MVIYVCETMTLSHNRAFVAYKTQIRAREAGFWIVGHSEMGVFGTG